MGRREWSMSAGVGYRVVGVHVGVGVRLCVVLTSGIAGGHAGGMSGRRGVVGVSLGVGVYELASEGRGLTWARGDHTRSMFM